MKIAKSVSPVWDGERVSRVVVKIDGLGVVNLERSLFEIDGINQRPIDPAALRVALGGASDELIDKICEFVFKHDLVEILTERITLG